MRRTTPITIATSRQMPRIVQQPPPIRPRPASTSARRRRQRFAGTFDAVVTFLVLSLLASGARVALWDLDRGENERTAAAIGAPEQVTAITADVSSMADVDAYLDSGRAWTISIVLTVVLNLLRR
mgnify:CR=1 FL=1